MTDIRVGILTVSDTASRDASADTSGPVILEILLTRGGFDVRQLRIVADEPADIQSHISSWIAEGKVDLILTTGGTGFGPRDRTPEAIGELIERPAPGLVHLLLSTSLQQTPLAALSRPVAGTIKDTLVVTLPGSVRAVRENMDALLAGGVVQHAVELVRGGSGSAVHAALAASAGEQQQQQPARLQHTHHNVRMHPLHHVHHDHAHPALAPRAILSHDPEPSAAARHRVSPYPLLSFKEAMDAIMQHVQPLPVERRPVGAALKGYVLAEDVYATQDVPSLPTTNVDGYAVRSTDKPGVYKVVTPSTHRTSDPLPEGTIYRINTGAPLPRDTDAVVMVEDTRLVSSLKDADGHDVEEDEVELMVSVPAMENIRAPGSDIKQGELALHKGEVLRSVGGEIGTLVFVGRRQVEVIRKPVVGILSTGNELLDIADPSPQRHEGWGGIWDTNRPSLQAALEGLGYEVRDLGIVSDQVDAHVAKIKQGLTCDILLTTGGTSMGASDLLKPIIERHFGGTIHVGRVKIKPGKPTTFATIPSAGGRTTPLFALPGNPASALVTFHVFVVPVLRTLGGWPARARQYPRVAVKLHQSMRLDPRVEFHRVVIRAGSEGLGAFSTGGQRSSRVASLSGANGLVVLPMLEEGRPDKLESGSQVEAMVIGEIEMYETYEPDLYSTPL